MGKYIIEYNKTKDIYEIYKQNKKGFYNFVEYVEKDKIELWKHQHKKCILILKG